MSKRLTIMIATADKMIPVDGYIYGGFGVHRRVLSGGMTSKTEWTVTHLASGFNIGVWPRRKASAEEIARTLDKEYPELRDSPRTKQEVKAFPKTTLGKSFQVRVKALREML